MNHIPRLIARMDIKNTQLIKSIRYEGLNVIGPAKEYTKKYYRGDKGMIEENFFCIFMFT